MVQFPYDANYTNGSISGLDFTTDLTAYYATATGTDAALGTSDNGGNWVEPAFDTLPNNAPEIWTTNYWQQPYIWDSVSVDTDDKTQFSGYGAWSLFDLANGNSTTFYVIRAGHKN